MYMAGDGGDVMVVVYVKFGQVVEAAVRPGRRRTQKVHGQRMGASTGKRNTHSTV